MKPAARRLRAFGAGWFRTGWVNGSSILFAAFLLTACQTAIDASPPETPTDLSALVAGEGADVSRSALLIVRLEDGARWASGGARIDERFQPASTSKIPHTLIALETGLVHGPDTPFAWDGVDRSIAAWNQDQTMATAFARSAVWVYQEIASRLGRETMSDWLTRFDYGNQDVGGEADLTTYWLRGPLAISAREQTDFLERLVRRDLPLSDRTYAIGEAIMRTDAGDGWTLYAKTGWRHDGVTVDIGWYVGWLETTVQGRAQTYVFAFNLDMLDPQQDRGRRAGTVRAALTEIGALPPVTPD